MADIHDRGRALAIRQLAPRPAGKGAPLVLKVITKGPRDPATGATPPPTEVTHTGSGLRTKFAFKDIDGVRVLQTDYRMLVSPTLANGTDMPEPKPGNHLQFDGGQWLQVVSAAAWNYAGVQIGFVVQARAM